jgi:hypothetical protein
MNCPECKDWLQEVLDNEALAADRPEVEAHLAACAACRELFQMAQQLRQALRGALPPAPPAGFADRVTARLMQSRRRRQRWWAGAAAGALAASLLAWLLVSALLPTGREPPVGELVSPVVPKLDLPPEPRPSLAGQLRDARDATLTLTRQVAQDTARQASILIPRVPEPAEPVPHLPAPPAALPDMGRAAAVGLEPVTDSARRAWDVLWRMVPAAEEKPGL